MLRLCSCLVAGAIGVAPPAVIPAPVQPAVLPAHAVVSQTSGINVGIAAAPALNSGPTAQLAPSLRGQPAIMPTDASGNTESEVIQAFGRVSDDVADDSFHEVSQPMYVPKASSSEWASSLGALVLAAVAGAVAGSLWLRMRVRAMQTKDSTTEMAATSSVVWAEEPKFAVAAFATRTTKYDPLMLSDRRPEQREAELKHGRVAMFAFASALKQETLSNNHHFSVMPRNAKKTDSAFTRAQQQIAGALVAGAAAMPQPAAAAELTYDGFGPPELVAIFLPITLIILGYLEWESKQPGVDDITGVGTLGKTVDGPANDPLSYKRRSPEYD